MANLSDIEWTEVTWNPLTGCSKISEGCKNCYAERMSTRLRAMGVGKYKAGFAVTLHKEVLQEPLRWRRPKVVFVNSMSDLFHESVPTSFIEAVFDVMRQTPRHTYQVLTKRAERAERLGRHLSWTSNVWLGVSIESERWIHRLEHLRATGAQTKFLSLEPLLGPLPDLNLSGIDWVIAGGESGPGARPMDPDWVRGIRDNCASAEVPFFFKQWGGVFKKRTGRLLDGRTWDEIPVTPSELRIASPQ